VSVREIAVPEALPGRSAPRPLPPPGTIDLPEALGYRLKRKLLGRPLTSDQLEEERLGKPTALAVFASDNLSSCAYASEEILHVLVPMVGVAAFSLLVPITLAMLVVLFFLILSYRETIKEYPSAGGAYVVTRDNFGPRLAQVAGVSLLTDYVLTVAVSVSAGTAALASAFDAFEPWRVPLAVAFIALIAYLNLRGVRESGGLFRIPTYFFIVMMAVLIAAGALRYFFGDLPIADYAGEEGVLEFGDKGDGLLLGASLFGVLHAFASGGAAVTGVEAISNGVPAFKQPDWKNARHTLVMMGSILAVMFFGLSALAGHMHVSPFEEGTPTVLSQVGDLVFGDSAVGSALFYFLQVGTMLILVLAANTAYAGFPRLASFQASDQFLPKQLTKRGHRLVYSNGMLILSVLAVVLVVVTDARVEKLIPLYAVGVFTGFSLSQFGMVRHHRRKRQPGWKAGIVVNLVGAVLSTVVLVIVGVTKFTHGAWVIIVTMPILAAGLVRLQRIYVKEANALQRDAAAAASAPILRRHVVLVFIDHLDRSSAAAIQYARTLTPDELRAVHIASDEARARELQDQWATLPLARLTLELRECPDRRIERAALELVAEETADGETEVTVLLPRRVYKHFWQRLLHDKTAENIADAVGRLHHANVTQVPFNFETAALLDADAGAVR
jgi:amino acid transporter